MKWILGVGSLLLMSCVGFAQGCLTPGVCPWITTPLALPSGFTGTSYSETLSTGLGYPPYAWSVTSGALPAGLTLSSTGVIAGIPTTAGTSTFSVTVANSYSPPATSSATFTLAISLDPQPLVIATPSALPLGSTGSSYSQTLAATGGASPYVWVIASGALPAGLALSSGGAVSGIPTAAGVSTFSVAVYDSNVHYAGQSFTLAVSGGQLTISTPSALPSGLAGAAYSQTLAATGGVPPYTWAVTSGALPPGLTLGGASGAISGNPTAGGAYNFTVQVKDSVSTTASAAFTLGVTAPCSYSISPTSASYAASGGTGAIAVTATAGCSWTVSNSLSWVTITGGASGTGNGTVMYLVGANTGGPRYGSFTIAGLTFIVQEVSAAPLTFAGSMAQIASAGGWDTSLTLVNLGATQGEARLNFFANDGTTPQLPFTFPQQPALGTILGSTFDQNLNAGATLLLDTTGPASQPVTGWSQLLTSGDINGFAIFDYTPTGQQAVVPLETRNAASYLLAFDDTGVLTTGLAIANLATSPANVGVVIRDDTGKQIGTGTVSLAAQGHNSFMLTDTSSGGWAVTAGGRGTVEFDTPSGGRISVLGLRANAIPNSSGFAVTSLPVLAGVGTGGGTMAHIASGGGWQTTFTLVNTGSAAATANLSFFGDSGSAVSLPLSFPQTSTASTANNVSQSIPAGGSLIVVVQDSGGAISTTGSAVLTTTGNVGGFAVFRYNPTGQEAVVPLQSVNATSYILAFDDTGSLSTGLAIANVAPQAANVNVIIRDDTGKQIGTGLIYLPAQGHTSFMLTDTSSGGWAVTAGVRGTVEFDTPSGGKIAPLGLRAATISGGFTVTTIPVMAP